MGPEIHHLASQAALTLVHLGITKLTAQAQVTTPYSFSRWFLLNLPPAVMLDPAMASI